MASGTRGFLQPAGIAPNMGANSGGREGEIGMNEPRGDMGGLYSGIQEVAPPPYAPSPREGNPGRRSLGLP
jgi:hypothetical protein